MNARWIILACLVAVFLMGAGAAQDASGAADAPAGFPLAPWLTPVVEGLPWVLALGGAIGAVAVALPLVGGLFPGTVGATDLKRRQVEIDFLSARYQEYLTDGTPNSEADGLANRVTQMEDQLRRDKLAQFLIGFACYVFLGTVLATFIAQSFYQAILFGFTAPAIVGQIVSLVETRKALALKDDVLADAQVVVAGSGGSSPSPRPASAVVLPDKKTEEKEVIRDGETNGKARHFRHHGKGGKGETIATEVLGFHASPALDVEEKRRRATLHRIKVARRI